MNDLKRIVIRDERGKVVEDDSGFELGWVKGLRTGYYTIEEWYGSEKVQVTGVKVEVA